MIAYGPRIISAVFAAVGDLATYKLGARLGGINLGITALACQIFNWFYFYTCVRTYSNSIECVLTTCALAYWPLGPTASSGRGHSQTRTALIFAALAVIMRPSAAIFWIYLGLRHLICGFDLITERAQFLFLQVIPIGTIALLSMILIDRWGYGTWTNVPYNFFRINVIENVSAEYGVHVWHWYITECIPAITGTWIPAIAMGVKSCLRTHRRARMLLEFVVWGFLVLSFNGHKELRFALPMVPVLSVIAGIGVTEMPCCKARDYYLRFAQLSNIIAALYLSTMHQAAPVPLMDNLAMLRADSDQGSGHFIDFYTRCHATPYWSHVHGADISRMRFLDCSPSLPALAKVPTMSMHYLQGIEEEDDFFQQPLERLRTRLVSDSLRQPPTRLIFTTETVCESMLSYIETSFGYWECDRFPHTPSIDYVMLCSNETMVSTKEVYKTSQNA